MNGPQKIDITKLIVGDLQTNCYIVNDILTEKCIVIDPGDGADVISEQILTQNLELEAIIATHGHFDHVLASWELQNAFNVPFLIHEDDVKLLKRMNSSAEHWLGRKFVEKPPEPDTLVEDGDEIKFGRSKLEILLTPGHSPGGISLYNSKEKIVFTGDTMFDGAVGRTDWSYSSHDDLEKSLQRIKSKFEGFHAYPGHEREFVV